MTVMSGMGGKPTLGFGQIAGVRCQIRNRLADALWLRHDLDAAEPPQPGTPETGSEGVGYEAVVNELDIEQRLVVELRTEGATLRQASRESQNICNPVHGKARRWEPSGGPVSLLRRGV